MAIHRVKTHHTYFQQVIRGIKTWEYRFNDRDYREGDTLQHIEVDDETLLPTGNVLETTVTYLLKGGQVNIPHEYCIMSIKLIQDSIKLGWWK